MYCDAPGELPQMNYVLSNRLSDYLVILLDLTSHFPIEQLLYKVPILTSSHRHCLPEEP